MARKCIEISPEKFTVRTGNMLNFSGITFIHVAELEIIYDHQQGGTENKTNLHLEPLGYKIDLCQ